MMKLRMLSVHKRLHYNAYSNSFHMRHKINDLSILIYTPHTVHRTSRFPIIPHIFIHNFCFVLCSDVRISTEFIISFVFCPKTERTKNRWWWLIYICWKHNVCNYTSINEERLFFVSVTYLYAIHHTENSSFFHTTSEN